MLRRDAGVRAHAEPDDRHLGDVESSALTRLRADLARRPASTSASALREVVARHA